MSSGVRSWATAPGVPSGIAVLASALDFCADQPDPAAFVTVEAGNVQIHRSSG